MKALRILRLPAVPAVPGEGPPDPWAAQSQRLRQGKALLALPQAAHVAEQKHLQQACQHLLVLHVDDHVSSSS